MEPSMHSALHGKVYVDALDQELTPVELKKEIDSTKQGIGARIIHAIMGIFRSDSSRVAELKKDIVEINQLLKKMEALESAKSVDPENFPQEEQKNLDDCHSKVEKLGVQINKLWETPSVKALYIQTAVKNAVRDGQTELKELRSKMQEANSKYETMKTEKLGTANSRVNDIENAKKELEGVHKKREALAHALSRGPELDELIPALEDEIKSKKAQIDNFVSRDKGYDVTDLEDKRKNYMGAISVQEKEIDGLVEKLKQDPQNEGLSKLIDHKRDYLNRGKKMLAEVEDQLSTGKYSNVDRSRMVNELEKAKNMLAAAQTERKTLRDALQVESNIDHQVAVLTDAQMKLAKLDKSRPEELEVMKKELMNALRSMEDEILGGQNVLQAGKRSRNMEMEVSQWKSEVETLKDSLDAYIAETGGVGEYESGKNAIINTIGFLEDQIEKATAEIQKGGLQTTQIAMGLNEVEENRAHIAEFQHELENVGWELKEGNWPPEVREHLEVVKNTLINNIEGLKQLNVAFTETPAGTLLTAGRKQDERQQAFDELLNALQKTKSEQVDFEKNKNALINLIEKTKTAIAEEKGKRGTEFFGDVASMDVKGLHAIDKEIKTKTNLIAEMQRELDELTTRPSLVDVGAPKPYLQLLPEEHKSMAMQLFEGLLGQLNDATSNLEQLADEVSGTPAHADVLQLLKDLEAAKKEIPFDMQAILKEKAEGVTAKEQSERITGDKRLDVRKNNIQKNKAAVAKLVEEKKMAVDELARLMSEKGTVAAGIKVFEPPLELRKALDSAQDELDQAKLMKERSNLRTVSALAEFQEKIDQAERKVSVARDALNAATPQAEREVVRPVRDNQGAISLLEDKIREREDAIRRLDTETRRLEEEVKKLERGESIEERLM